MSNQENNTLHEIHSLPTLCGRIEKMRLKPRKPATIRLNKLKLSKLFENTIKSPTSIVNTSKTNKSHRSTYRNSSQDNIFSDGFFHSITPLRKSVAQPIMIHKYNHIQTCSDCLFKDKVFFYYHVSVFKFSR